MSQTPPDELFIAFQQALAGRYFIDRELGRGGMGVVYLAREVHLDRLVAIKLLPPALAERASLRDRFLGEARLAAKLSHPHVVPIHAVEERDGFVFFVMALVDGITLAERVRTRGPLSASEGARILREVAFALDHAHAQGVVHRDVKPDNILIESASGRAMVADFGIAAVAGDAAPGGVAGTPEFMSPEQALGRDVDMRSDLYSLGVTAYYLLSGRLPFEGKSATEVIARHVNEAPEPLSSLGLAVPRKLARLVDRCLAKDPADRPESARALAEQLGVAIEQRRELPAALRGFAKRGGRMDSGGTLIYLSALGGVNAYLSYKFGAGVASISLVTGLTVGPAVFIVSEARRMLALGFGHADLLPAFKHEMERAREEFAVQPGKMFRGLERIMHATARISLSFLGVAIPVTLLAWVQGVGRASAVNLWPLYTVIGIVGGSATLAYRTLRQMHHDVDTEFWARFWSGRVGAAAFAVARKLRGSAPTASAVTHRATELSLGMAAEQLYESLPKATRKSLEGVPGVLRRLQEDAQALRARYDALNDVVGQGGSAGSEEVREAIRAERDVVHGRLRDAVGALENMRLNLLRLHAGSLSVQSVTTQIDLANALSDDVRRLMAARESVDELLKFPSEIEHTPV